MVTLYGLIHRLNGKNRTVSQNKHHRIKALVSSRLQRMVTLHGLIHRLEVKNRTVSQNKPEACTIYTALAFDPSVILSPLDRIKPFHYQMRNCKITQI